MFEKRYRFLEGIDWDYVQRCSLTQSEISIYSKRLGLPSKQFIPISLHLNLLEKYNDVLTDFLKEKYSSLWDKFQLVGGESDYSLSEYLAGYFKEQIDLWLKNQQTD